MILRDIPCTTLLSHLYVQLYLPTYSHVTRDVCGAWVSESMLNYQLSLDCFAAPELLQVYVV